MTRQSVPVRIFLLLMMSCRNMMMMIMRVMHLPILGTFLPIVLYVSVFYIFQRFLL